MLSGHWRWCGLVGVSLLLLGCFQPQGRVTFAVTGADVAMWTTLHQQMKTTAVSPVQTNLPLLLPDLQMRPPYQLWLERAQDGSSRRIRFSTSTVNRGAGPLEMRGYYHAELNRTRALQRIRLADGQSIERYVGDFVFHPTHNHWHFEDFSESELWSYHPDGALDQRLAATGKVSFCMVDIVATNPDLPGAPPAAVYTKCDQELQGISVGWSDTYTLTVAGQELDVTHLPGGHYALRTTVDPANRLLESNESNNSVVVYIELTENRVARLPEPFRE